MSRRLFSGTRLTHLMLLSMAVLFGCQAGAMSTRAVAEDAEQVEAQAPQRPVVLVSKGRVIGRIVVADMPDHIGLTHHQWHLDKTRSARYAAEFLQEYIEHVTGVTVPIISESEAKYLGRPMVVVGRSSLTDFVEAERQQLEPEGYLIRRKPHEPLIAIVGEIADEDDLPEYRGADRGTLFGVYRFIEESMGVRWYFAGRLGTVVPRRDTVGVNHIDIKEAPHFRMRLDGIRDVNPEIEGLEPSPFDSVHPAIRPGNTTGFMANHSSNDWWRYAEEHPEIFAVNEDGERRIDPTGYGSSAHNHLNYLHPKVLEIDMQRVRDFYERDTNYWPLSIMPNSRYVRFFPKDIHNIHYDRSPETLAMMTPERENSGLSEVIHGYAAKFARRLKEEYPDKRLAFGAYAGFLLPPTTVQLPDNADVMLVTLKGNSKLVAPGHWKHTTGLVDAWYEHLGEDRNRIYLWEYFCYPNHHIQFYPYTMKRWMQFCKDKVGGAFNNGFGPRRDRKHLMEYRLSQLNGWLWHQLLWNPDADVDVLMARFHDDLFGSAAGPMSELFALSIDAYENAPWGDNLNAGAVSHVHRRFLYREVYDVAYVEKARALLAEAREVVSPGTIYAERVEYFGEAFEDAFYDAAKHHIQYGLIEAPEGWDDDSFEEEVDPAERNLLDVYN